RSSLAATGAPVTRAARAAFIGGSSRTPRAPVSSKTTFEPLRHPNPFKKQLFCAAVVAVVKANALVGICARQRNAVAAGSSLSFSCRLIDTICLGQVVRR